MDQVTIKRYANRKLYDTSSSRYITLNEVVGLVREGTPVRVIQNSDKKDITGPILAAAVFSNNTQFDLPPGEFIPHSRHGPTNVSLLTSAKSRKGVWRAIITPYLLFVAFHPGMAKNAAKKTKGIHG